MNVSNLINSNGNKVRNQFVISSDGKKVFQSYNTKMASISADGISVIKNWEISSTTRKYLFQFLREFAGIDLNTAKMRKIQADSKQNLIIFSDDL